MKIPDSRWTRHLKSKAAGMTISVSDQPFKFSDLPTEIRVRIYEILFFGCEEDEGPIQPQRHVVPDPWAYGIVVPSFTQTARRQVYPYCRPEYHQSKLTSRKRFSLAIFRVSKAIQAESEPAFYGTASFNLMETPIPGGVDSWRFFSTLPRRYRGMIRRVEHFCYNSGLSSGRYSWRHPYHSSFDWKLFMTILVQECTALQSLKLWIVRDAEENQWLAEAGEADPWIQAILRLAKLENLRHFEMPAMAAAAPVLSSDVSPLPTPDILPWLQARLIGAERPTASTVDPKTMGTPLISVHFPLLRLPFAIRARIYRHTLLPDNKQIYPYIRPWYDGTTRNAVPLLLTCRTVRNEAEDVLYGEAIFRLPETTSRFVLALQDFFQELDPRLRAKVRRVSFPDLYCIQSLVDFASNNMQLDRLILRFSPQQASSHNLLWNRRGRKILTPECQRKLGAISNIEVEVAGQSDIEVLPEFRAWMEIELREEWLKIEERRQSLRSSRTTLATS